MQWSVHQSFLNNVILLRNDKDAKDSKMHLHLRHMRGTDSKGRVHISLEDMAEIYRNFHAALNDTYWETASNHKICTDAMEMLKTTHISKKNGRFLFLFTSVLSEAYSHAHYNMQELFYDDRDVVRANYWADILVMYKVVMAKADKVYSHSKCAQRLALLLHFASLFSLYKDVADEGFIVALYQRAESYIVSDNHRLTDAELEQVKEYYDAIQTIYHLRGEQPRASDPRLPLEPDEAPTLVLGAADVTQEEAQASTANFECPLSKDELCGIYDKALARHQKIVMKRQQTEDLEGVDDVGFATPKESPSQVDAAAAEERDASQSSSIQPLESEGQSSAQPAESELRNVSADLASIDPSAGGELHDESVLGQCNSSGAETKEAVVALSNSEEPFKALDEFDFRAEFDRRFREKKTPSTEAIDLPVIGKPNKDDVVHSYRRRGLFDNVEYRRPPLVHGVSSLDNPDTGIASKTRTVFSYDEVDLDRRMEGEEELNNNILSPNSYMTEKIVRAVLAEKPVSPLTPNRRMSVV